LEIKAFIGAGCLAIVPTGCTEQQGPHLPIDFDTWFAETVALAAAKHAACFHQVRALVLPPMPFGPTPEHKGYGSGYVTSRIRFMKNAFISPLYRSQNRASVPSLSGEGAESIGYRAR
jgi:creatinine amidohydrolase/Fe(II)-dependent formamide hydrolase-like protein